MGPSDCRRVLTQEIADAATRYLVPPLQSESSSNGGKGRGKTMDPDQETITAIKSSKEASSNMCGTTATAVAAATATATSSDGISDPSSSKKKRKMRHSRQKKRERKQAKEQEQQQEQQRQQQQNENEERTEDTQQPNPCNEREPHQEQEQERVYVQERKRRRRRKQQQQISFEERIRKCGMDAESKTGSVVVEKSNRSPSSSFSTSSTSSSYTDESIVFRIISCTNLERSRQQYPITDGFEKAANNFTTTIRVQPLLILDLNGILCHRSRRRKEPVGVTLRPSLGADFTSNANQNGHWIAGTPIIPRSDLIPFINLLDKHFCLAVWTSAKPKTARRLLRALMPENIINRLLFVWTQHQCDAVQSNRNESKNNNTSISMNEKEPNDNDDINDDVKRIPSPAVAATTAEPSYDDRVFQKLLHKVWKAYPLWNADNTLLIDDSPEKCPYASANCVHPPPIHGQAVCPPGFHESSASSSSSSLLPSLSSRLTTSKNTWYPDSYNETLQEKFFHKLIDHWNTHPHERIIHRQVLTSETLQQQEGVVVVSEEKSKMEQTAPEVTTNDATKRNEVHENSEPQPMEVFMNNEMLWKFLSQDGIGHMGWRGNL